MSAAWYNKVREASGKPHCPVWAKIRKRLRSNIISVQKEVFPMANKPMTGTIRELITFLHLRNTPGRSIDRFVCATDVAKHADRPLLLVRLESLNEMLHMCRDANRVICVPDAGKTYAGALFSDVSTFPVARFYHVQLGGDLIAAGRMYGMLKEQRFEVEIPHSELLSEFIQENGWRARLAKHLAVRRARVQDYEKLRSGRCSNTTTNSTLFLNSTGCIICDGAPDFIASMTVAAPGEPASLMAVRLCSAHMAEAREDSALVKLLSKGFRHTVLDRNDEANASRGLVRRHRYYSIQTWDERVRRRHQRHQGEDCQRHGPHLQVRR